MKVDCPTDKSSLAPIRVKILSTMDMLALSAGEKGKGYDYPLHHPKADFDESVLYIGALAYALSALTE